MIWDNNEPTDVDKFLRLYKEDKNVFWYVENGHLQTIIDELIDRLSNQQVVVNNYCVNRAANTARGQK